MLRRLPQGVLFVAVGVAAAAVHLLVAGVLVAGLGWLPLVANVLAFLVAFAVSYQGHAGLTFARTGTRGRGAALRFFVVASLGFAANEGLYHIALHWLHWHWFWSLALVLCVVAGGTFVLGKLWAFAPRKAVARQPCKRC